jgi:hypothetical protein
MDTTRLITLAPNKNVSIVQAKTVVLLRRCRPTIVGSTLRILMILFGLRLVSLSYLWDILYIISVRQIRNGVKVGEGDGTVSLLSLGAMCVEGWKRPRWNPANIKITTVEVCLSFFLWFD